MRVGLVIVCAVAAVALFTETSAAGSEKLRLPIARPNVRDAVGADDSVMYLELAGGTLRFVGAKLPDRMATEFFNQTNQKGPMDVVRCDLITHLLVSSHDTTARRAGRKRRKGRPGFVVDLRADRRCSWKSVQWVASLLASNGVSRLRFAVKEFPDSSDTDADARAVELPRRNERVALRGKYEIRIGPSGADRPGYNSDQPVVRLGLSKNSLCRHVGKVAAPTLAALVKHFRSESIKRCTVRIDPEVRLLHVLATAARISALGGTVDCFVSKDDWPELSAADIKKRTRFPE